MKRLLFVTYYFPPAGGSATQRIVKLTRYLPEFGWQPIILTARDGSFPSRDERLGEQLPQTLPVHRVSGFEPFKLYNRFMGRKAGEGVGVGFAGDGDPGFKERMARWVRGNLFLPDARKGWIKPAVRQGREVIRTGKIDAILSSGPPHSVHLAARRLAQLSGLPWVADFRDPWTDIDYYDDLNLTDWARRKDAALEASVLKRATKIVTISPGMLRMLEAKAGRKDVQLIYNGADPADFPDQKSEPADRFRITYAGSMNAARNPEVFWSVLGELVQAGRIGDVEISLLGTIDPSVFASLSESGLMDFVQAPGNVPHHEVTATYQRSAVLLLVVNRIESDHVRAIMPAKMYEYLASRRPILAIGPPDGDAGRALAETRHAYLSKYDDRTSLESAIVKLYDRWKTGLAVETPLPDLFNRRNQAGQMADLLNTTLEETA